MTSTTTLTTTQRTSTALHLALRPKPGTPTTGSQTPSTGDHIENGLESQRSLRAASASLQAIKARPQAISCKTPEELREAVKTHPFAHAVTLAPVKSDAFCDADLALLRRFRRLRSVSIGGRFAISNATAEKLGELNGLKELHLHAAYTRNTQLDDIGMHHLKSLTKLRKFSACGVTHITDAALKNLSSIRHLKLGAAERITGSGLANIHRLKSLELNACDGLSDAGIRSLRELDASLESVALTFCKGLTASSVLSLNRLMRVHTLNLHGSERLRPNLAHFETMADAGDLRNLTLHSAIQSHAGSPIARLPKLKRLNLRYAPGIPSPYRLNIGHGSMFGSNPAVIQL